MTPPVFVIFIAAWLTIGFVTGLWMMRRGHDPRWMLIAVILGPLFVSAAIERVERRPRLAVSGPESVPAVNREGPGGPRVLVGMDGSPQSERALATAVELFGPTCQVLVLAEVVYYDATDEDNSADLDGASERLGQTADRIGGDVPVRFEVLAGPPGDTLRQFAREQEMDLLVVGRRGRGVSARFLGSVSSELVQRSAVPVLVVEPAPVARSSSEDGSESAQRSDE